jgi:GNAT superfamily N-acetyltransferase
MTVEVSPVRSRRDREAFISLPFRLYGNDPNWVPPLRQDIAKLIAPARHPFHGHASVELFLARREGRATGRIAAIENRAHNDFHGERIGFFGLFETERDQETAGALLDAASAWLGARGLVALRGPASFSTNEECALLVEGFESPPCIMMTYNPPFYMDLLEAAGFSKAKDLLAYYLAEGRVPEILIARARQVAARTGVTVRPMNMKRYRAEVELVKAIYNKAWERNWGFVPMTDEEMDHMAKELKPVVDPNLVLFLETPSGPAGFTLALPDANAALIHVRDGRLWPFGIIKLLWHIRRVHRLRVLTLGLLPEFRRQGLDNLLYLELYQRGTGRGYTSGEFSWILEDNGAMNRALEKIGARVYKRYRFYERPIPAASH